MAKYMIDRGQLFEWQDAAITAFDMYPWLTANGERQAAMLYNATSSGKTRTHIALAFREAARTGKRSVIVAPGKTTAQRYAEEWQPEGGPSLGGTLVRGANLPELLPILTGDNAKPASMRLSMAESPVLVVTAMWFLNRLKTDPKWVEEIGLVIFDEGQHAAAETYKRIVDAIPLARILFSSGTPVRHDKERLPLVPYVERAIPGKRGGVEYELRDLAEVSGVMGARFTLADAVSRRAVKRVSKESTCVPVEATELSGSNVDASSLDDYRAKARKEGLAFNPFSQPLVRRETFVLARRRHEITLKRYPGKPWKVIAKVARIDDAYDAVADAKAAGWNPVVVHGDSVSESRDEEMLSARVKLDLARFNAERSGVDLCIQVNTLTEGYNNPLVYMCIWLCNVESDVTVAQFNGRALRLCPDIDYADHPEVQLVFANIEPLRRKQERYVALANELSFKIIPGDGPGPGGDDDPEWATLEAGKFFILGEDWEREVAKRDPVREAVTNVLAGKDASPELRAHLEEQVRSGTLAVSGFDPFATKPIQTSDPMGALKLRRNEVAEWLKQNGFQHRGGRSDRKWAELRFRATGAAMNEMWPGIRGGMKNENLDLGQVAECLQADIEIIRKHALKLLREFNQRGLCRDGAA